MADNKWVLPNSPPPPMFLGEKDRNYVKQINDEISERIVGQTVIYYPIDIASTNFHSLYGEAIEKNFLAPIRVYAMVKWENDETTTENIVLDKDSKITFNFLTIRFVYDYFFNFRWINPIKFKCLWVT